MPAKPSACGRILRRLRDFTPSRNNLSTSRTLLQVDENYELNDSNNFFAREWFVYEPPYSFNSANNGRAVRVPHGLEPEANIRASATS